VSSDLKRYLLRSAKADIVTIMKKVKENVEVKNKKQLVDELKGELVK